MKVFVTGGTGFIGGRVVRKLLGRGYEVRTLVRSEQAAETFAALGTKAVLGDITEIETMRSAMQNCEMVFHLAAWYKIGKRQQALAEKINVDGTRNVLGLAYELKIPKIIYTSTIAVFGDTHGQIVDETYRMPVGQPFLTTYDRTKWQAHYEVALPLIQKGAPITIVMPGAVYGPGDQSLIGQMMRAYYQGLLTFFPGPETRLTYAHVEDVAEGHLLAAEKGRAGESYILAGPALSFRQIVPLWAKVSGQRPPIAYIPSCLLKPLLPLSQLLSQLPGWPEMLSPEAVRILGATYIACADKASQELGWQIRPLEQGLSETFAWIAGITSPMLPLSPPQKRASAAVIIGAALGLLAAWALTRKRR